MQLANRLHFMDNLRGIIIVMVILLHTSLCYMAYAPEWWYVLDPDRSLFFTCIVLLVDVFIMPAMFFISGYFTFSSLRRKGTPQFIRDKGWRIALPWVMGVVLLALPLAYMIYFSRSIPLPYLDFLTGDLLTKSHLPLLVKFSLTMTLAVVLSWASSSLMRKTPLLKKIF